MLESVVRVYWIDITLDGTERHYAMSPWGVDVGGVHYEAAPAWSIRRLSWDQVDIVVEDDGALLDLCLSEALPDVPATVGFSEWTEGEPREDVTLVDGGVVRASAPDNEVRLVVSPAYDRRKWSIQERGSRDACKFRYKRTGGPCQSTSGDATCAHTETDCSSKSNITHFGGFPDAPEAGDQVTLVNGQVWRVGAGADIGSQERGGDVGDNGSWRFVRGGGVQVLGGAVQLPGSDFELINDYLYREIRTFARS